MKLKYRWNILFGLGVAVMIFAAFALYRTKIVYRDTQERYDDIRETFVTVSSPETISLAQPEEKTVTAEEVQEKEVSWADLMTVDLDGLQAAYPDVAGWLYFEDGEISYPILYSGDNETYLYRDYTGEKSPAGAIFLDETFSPDLSDAHPVLYGHNMRNGSMFGALKRYPYDGEEDAFHNYIQIITPEEKRRYRITTGAEVADTDVKRPLVEADRTLTLSTCTASDTKRRVVCAVFIESFHTELKK